MVCDVPTTMSLQISVTPIPTLESRPKRIIFSFVIDFFKSFVNTSPISSGVAKLLAESGSELTLSLSV